MDPFRFENMWENLTSKRGMVCICFGCQISGLKFKIVE